MPTPLFAHVPIFWRLNEPHKTTHLEKNQFKCQRMPGFHDIQNLFESSATKVVSIATLISKALLLAKALKESLVLLRTPNQTRFWKEFMMSSKHPFARPIQAMKMKQTIQSIKLLRLHNMQSECAHTKPVAHHQAAWHSRETCSHPSPLW